MMFPNIKKILRKTVKVISLILKIWNVVDKKKGDKKDG